MKNILKIELILVIFFVVFPISASQIVIANVDSTEVIKKETIKKIYLGREKLWQNGSKVKLTILTENGYLSDFIKRLLNKNSNDFILYWKQLLFTGRGIPPTEFSTTEDIITYIAKTKGAIGFVPENQTDKIPNNLKKVFVE